MREAHESELEDDSQTWSERPLALASEIWVEEPVAQHIQIHYQHHYQALDNLQRLIHRQTDQAAPGSAAAYRDHLDAMRLGAAARGFAQMCSEEADILPSYDETTGGHPGGVGMTVDHETSHNSQTRAIREVTDQLVTLQAQVEAMNAPSDRRDTDAERRIAGLEEDRQHLEHRLHTLHLKHAEMQREIEELRRKMVRSSGRSSMQDR